MWGKLLKFPRGVKTDKDLLWQSYTGWSGGRQGSSGGRQGVVRGRRVQGSSGAGVVGVQGSSGFVRGREGRRGCQGSSGDIQ